MTDSLFCMCFLQNNQRIFASAIRNQAIRFMTEPKYNELQIPYAVLERFGLTEQMITDLPSIVVHDILDGRRSPVLPVTIIDEEGNKISSRTRFALVQQEDGQLDVMFYPQMQRENLERFTPENQERLLAGHVVQDKYARSDGESISAFLHLDSGTKQVIIVPAEVIGRNLDLLQREYKLSNAELSCLKNGEPLTVIDNDDEMTMGIDLKSRTGIRFCLGDAQKWKQQENTVWEKYNFGLYGCWQADADGNLSYTPEEEYDEEMWNELKKKGMRQQEQHARMAR